MEEKNNLEEHYRKTFRDFESVPPERNWEQIRAALHPSVQEGRKFDMLRRRIIKLGQSGRLYPFMAAAATILLFFFIWLSYSHKHSIRGHAYAGDSRLCMGTAYLFQVYDKVKPYDTVMIIQKSSVDQQGFYNFTGIDHGNYLVRINPSGNSETGTLFLPSFYGQDSVSGEADLIRIRDDDPVIDIHLVQK